VVVVGHVEWAEFARVERMPSAGEIVHAEDSWQEPAGGGAVAAVQLARLAGECLFITALGDDDLGRSAKAGLEGHGVRVAAAWRTEPQRRAFVHLDASAERTITVIGERMGPRGDDDLPWDELDGADAVYFTAGDPEAVRKARAAKRLVATTRARDALVPAGVELDALVASALDAGERYEPGDLEPAPRMVARTQGADGGSFEGLDGAGRWAAAPLPGPAVDYYGSGDCFAAGFTYGLAVGLPPADALALGARCGAVCATGRGPYGAMLTDP
jgi:ribokinase